MLRLTIAPLRAGVVLFVAALLATVAWKVALPATSDAQGAVAAPSLGAELRYIGRDGSTRMTARVDDRFIAQVEQGVARYGLDEGEPVPPPPADGAEPARLAIAALGVDASIARLGRDAYGRLDVPQDTTTVGWNPGDSNAPGEGQSTFLAAHYTYGGQPGVFNRLATLAPGSVIEVRLDDGTTHRYVVRSALDYELGVIDMGALLAGREGVESLVLMTCSGPIRDGNYQWRTVVLADRVDAA